MSIKKIITGLALLMLMSSGMAVAADYDKGTKALDSGDYKAALVEFIPLAEQGDAKAQGDLGYMYEFGYGVLKSYKTAVKWYTLAAEQGYADAQYNLALMYDDGEGVLENDKTAVKWYTLAAEQGHASAQGNLGVMYALGEGVLTDNQRAYMWLNLASYNGYESGGENKDKIAKDMTSAQIDKAQDMSSRCLDSSYTDC